MPEGDTGYVDSPYRKAGGCIGMLTVLRKAKLEELGD